MEVQKYCWLQVIVSFLYYSIVWIAIRKIFHGLIWANIRKQIFSKHSLPPYHCIHLWAVLLLFLLCKKFCIPESKASEKSQIKNVFLMIGPWLSSAESIRISTTIMVMTCISSGHRESKIPDRKEQFLKPHLCKRLEVAVCIHISEGKLRNGPHFQ